MSTNKTQKYSSSTTLTKIVSRITRTLSFSSKKHQQSSKKENKMVQQPQPILKNTSLVPKSVPVIRRPSQPISKILYNDNIMRNNRYRQGIQVNNESDNEDNDYSRYSLRPNLSLFNISTDDLQYQQVPQQQDWLNNILHSTKMDDF